MENAEDEEMEEEEEEEEEEEDRTSDFGQIGSSEDENRVMEWEDGLPSAVDLMPLSQPLIPPELASAFSISPEPYRTALDVSRASQDTLAILRRDCDHSFASNGLRSLLPFEDPTDETGNSPKDTSESRKGRRSDASEEAADSAADDHSARTLKRPRLVWTPQLHKRFVDVVAHLGIKSAVPKTIMNLMNVEGLTRENVASHLQKYRLYLKRMEVDGGPSSSSDQLFASTPVPQSFDEAAAGINGGGAGQLPIPMMPYATPAAQMMPMPVLGMPHGHMGRIPSGGVTGYHGFDSHPYNMFGGQQQREWSGPKYGSIMSYPHMTASDK